MFGSFGWMELFLILLIVLIIFGAGKIPQLGEGLGKAIKGFKKSVNETDDLDVSTPTSDDQEKLNRQDNEQRETLSGHGVVQEQPQDDQSEDFRSAQKTFES
ncbi:twin-arginine translocase TatA/TatE family subunit [Nitrospira sp. M1]